MKVTQSNIRAGIDKVRVWADGVRQAKRTNPQHKLVADIGMESVFTLRPLDLILRTHGAEALSSLSAMENIDMAQVWSELREAQMVPPGGAGGLGIIEETLCWTGVRFGALDHFSLYNHSLLHVMRRKQGFDGNRQTITLNETNPAESDLYHPLGELVSINFNGQETPVFTWLFTGFQTEKGQFVPSFKHSLNGVTGKLYPSCASQENFDQMHVLGQAGFNVSQHFGLIGTDEALTDVVIGHDGHSVLFKFNLFLYFFNRLGDHEKALRATRALCRATIHAPQNGTVPRTTGDMVRQHYSEAEEQRYGLFTVDPGKESNALIGEIHLSGQTGVVSPLHLMITEAEEQARRRGHANGAAQLLPEDVYIDQITLFPDTLDMRSWLGLGTMHVLDKFIPGWEDMSSQMLREPAFIDKWRFNEGFRKDLAAAYVMQEQHLLSLLGNHFEMRFEQQMPKDPIVFASLRRATSYKIGLIAEFLRRANIIDGIGRKLDRPIYYLFGGLAHQDDSESIDALQNLLRHMERINQEFEFFKANFLIGYDFELAKWIFPGLARRGCWVGATNPIGAGRSQDTEAFGPSYMKASLNGMRILGTHDGGAACLSYLPTVSLYGPATFAGDTSFHNDLWSNEALQRNSRVLLAQGFVSGLARVAGFIDQDLLRIEAGQACRTMGMDNQIASMFTLMADWNGRVLMDTYLDR